MGIPYYFSNITKEHPHIVRTSLDFNTTDYIFLDFNCAIHYCNNILRTENESVELSSEEHELLLIEKCIEYIEAILRNFNQVDVLYIEIDGPVPFAKMIQQRKRRFLSAWRKKKLNMTCWDSNAISPGTIFMKKLNDRLQTFSCTTKCQTIISSSEEPGEGEAKIYKYLEENMITNKNVIIYGLDADLIMLSLLANQNRIFLML